MKPISKVTFLSKDEQELMREKVFKLLGLRGVKMGHPEVLKILDEAGAEVDFEAQMVRFPKGFMEQVLRKSPNRLTLAGTTNGNDVEVPRRDGTFHFRTGTGARCYIDPESGLYRKVTISDVATLGKLADKLDEVSFCASPFPSDVPIETADIHALKALLQNTQKHVWVQPYSGASIQYLVEMAIVAAGGKETLKARPLVSFIACSLTPLEFKFMDLEIILQASRHGIPIHACSLPSAGGTAPITMPSVVLLSAAEILAILAVAQVIQPGVPVIATPLIFAMDMQSGRSLQSSVEAMQGAAAAVNFLKGAYGLPTHTFGSGTDSPDIDGQSMIERSLLGILVAMAGADILGGAGFVEVIAAFSPLQLIIDNEVAGMIRRIVSGLTFDDDTMAWDDLLTASACGHFLETDHTLRHCRDAFRPCTFIRQSREIWAKQGGKDLLARATETYYSMINEKGGARDLREDITKEMDRIVEAADWYLKK